MPVSIAISYRIRHFRRAEGVVRSCEEIRNKLTRQEFNYFRRLDQSVTVAKTGLTTGSRQAGFLVALLRETDRSTGALSLQKKVEGKNLKKTTFVFGVKSTISDRETI